MSDNKLTTKQKILRIGTYLTVLGTLIGFLADANGLFSDIRQMLTKKPLEGVWIGSFTEEGKDIHSQFIILKQDGKLVGKMEEVRVTKEGKIGTKQSALAWTANGSELVLEKNCAENRKATYKGTLDSSCDNFTGTWSDASSIGTFKFRKKE